jgi:hypothetical protein
MIVTPFGDLVYGDNQGLQSWLLAHDQRHRVELQAIGFQGVSLPYSSLAEKIDSDWFGRHVLNHLGMIRFAADDDTVSSQLLEMEWDNPQNFQVWHQMHNDLHSVLDQSLGISNAT